MPIANIVDRRKRQYRFMIVNAIIEPAWHDHSCKDSDEVTRVDGDDADIGYHENEHITLEAAIAWASSFAYPVTLYLYDLDGGIYSARELRMAHEAALRDGKERDVIPQPDVPRRSESLDETLARKRRDGW